MILWYNLTGKDLRREIKAEKNKKMVKQNGGQKMKKQNLLRRASAAVLSAIIAAGCAFAPSGEMTVSADELFDELPAFSETESLDATVSYVYYGGRKIARVKNTGTYVFINQRDPHLNGQALVYLLRDDVQKKIVLPAVRIETDRGLTIGSNKTILANGATVFQTNPQKQIINNDCDKLNYKSVENVKIQGGRWEIADNDRMLRDTSTIRFNHGSNIKLVNMDIATNYRSHGIEIIACKDVTISGCTVKASGTPASNCLEEAVQIDIATPATAPTVAAFGSKFVQGQTCENITVKNCTISGGRGICCNKTATEGKRYHSFYHKNITITGCNLTGVTSEALCLHNTYGVTVKNNTIMSKGSRINSTYSIGMNMGTFGYADASSRPNLIERNKIYGGMYGMVIRSYEGTSKFGSTVVRSNEFYCKKGSKRGKYVRDCMPYKAGGNRLYNW